MSMTWEDAEREAYYDHQLEEIEKEIANRKVETVAHFISEGFTASEDITSGIVGEVSKLTSASHSQSIGFLSSALLETIERETICLPLLVSGLGLSESDEKRIIQVKRMVSRGVDSPHFAYSYFEDVHDDVPKVKAHFDALVAKIVPGHQLFKVESTLWLYRERIQSFRNHVVHGRAISTSTEADYILAFSNQWRELVYNCVLNKFGLTLDTVWMLKDI